MTDEEYRAWQNAHTTAKLPKSKQRGLYPCFVWGGVGHNKKSELYFLDKGETLTADCYVDILKTALLPVRQQMPRTVLRLGGRGKLHITQDNDPKHYNAKSLAFFKRHNIKLVGSHRHDVHGETDRAPGPGGHQQKQAGSDRFPAYRCVM